MNVYSGFLLLLWIETCWDANTGMFSLSQVKFVFAFSRSEIRFFFM
jgi:hypothetical protein